MFFVIIISFFISLILSNIEKLNYITDQLNYNKLYTPILILTTSLIYFFKYTFV